MPNLSRNLQHAPMPKSGLKGIWCSLHFQTKDREPRLRTWVYKRQVTIPNHDHDAKPKSGTSSIIQSHNQYLKDIDVLCTFKIKRESQNCDHGCIKDQWPYPNQDQDAKPKSKTSSIVQSSKWGLKEQGCSLHLQNQDREPTIGSWVYQRPVTISKSSLKYWFLVRNIDYPKKT